MKKLYMNLAALLGALFLTITAYAYDGKVINSTTKAPIEGATVTLGDQAVKTAKDGAFHIEGTGDTLKLRAPGYTRIEIPTADLTKYPNGIALTPFKVKGLYLSDYGVTNPKIRNAALATIKKNDMNTLVIDVKGDHGFIPFKVDIPLAKEIGAQNITLVKDMPKFLQSIKDQGIYTIARIVVFKDDMLAGGRPSWAVKMGDGMFRDREHLRWVDPFNKEVWDYNIAIAKAAAEVGFDEVQFDYVRCPDKAGVAFSQPSTQESRTNTITAFLETAHKALVPYNIMLSADIFGYTIWNKTDTGIGQVIDRAINAVDIVSPMMYPSGFADGIPKYRNPVKNPYEVIYLTLKHAQARTDASPLQFRPWLQAFRDYAFGGVQFKEDKMRTQIKASDDFGASGYLFWNPRNVYPDGKFVD